MSDHTTRPLQPELPFDEIPYGYCHCGCGQLTRLAKSTNRTIGHVKGEPVQYIRGHNRARAYVDTALPYSVEGRFWSKVKQSHVAECWEWLSTRDGKGYGRFWDGERIRAAHAYSFEIFYGILLGEYLCCHSCDNPVCVNPHHLFAGSYADNNRDTRDKGRRYQPDVSGEKNGRAKLTRVSVEEVRKRFAAGESRASLSRAFGVSWTIIDYATKGHTWR